jgi:hypothetical protein
MISKERKAQSSKVMKLKWRKAEKYAHILKVPKEEVFNNLDLCVENSKGLLSYRPDTIAKVLKEGKWKEPFDEVSYWAKIKEEREKNTENSKLEIDKHNEAIRKKDQEKYDREKAENLGYKYESRDTHIETENVNIKTQKINGADLFGGLKVTMWWIKEVGSMEKAEKLFQAVKLSIEAAKE